MSLESLERIVGGSVGAAVAGIGAYNVWAHRSRTKREARMPEGGDVQSIIPFYQILPAIMEECGITRYAPSGGIAKQALADPETVFDPDNLQYKIVDPNSRTIERATLWRPGECTIRDLDIRVFELAVDGKVTTADARFDGNDGLKAKKAKLAQMLLNEHAKSIGFDKGPEVSLFFYERPFEGPFRADPHNYATRTLYDESSNEETLIASTGKHQLTLPRGELWECVVALPDKDSFTISVNAPAEHLGRTINRPIVERVRDRKDVDDALLNIRAKGFGDTILGNTWDRHENFRKWLDTALSAGQITKMIEAGDVTTAAHILLAKHIGVRIAPWIENGEIGKAIRDPETWIGKRSAQAMGA